MDKKTRIITYSALFSALAVVSLYFASVWPTGLLGLVAFASLFVAAAVIDMGIAPSIYVFAASSALGMLILPNKAAPILFISFFGYYPIIKCLIEKIPRVSIQWILKLLAFNAALTIIWFFIRELAFGFVENPPNIIVLYIISSAVFALFDYGYTKVVWLYIDRVSKHIKKG